MLPQDAFGQGVYGQPGLKVCGCHPKGLDEGHYISVILNDGVDTLLVHLPKVIKCLQTPVSINGLEFVVCTR